MAKSKVIEKVYEFVDEKILSEKLEEIVGSRFGAYSKYIIQDRAIPDARDGLKPVQRRILYGMLKLGLASNKPFKKSARIVGEVMGKYHPHGDISIYDALVRLSQDFKTNLGLVDMHGNNGSIDGDTAAAMRYTEARLSKAAEYLLEDIQKDTVMFVPNFDDEEYEPTVLPSKFPNLLVNGSTGISSGYATDIPPHNLAEVIDAVIYLMDNPKAEIDELVEIVKGPDFPTGGVIVGSQGIKEAYLTGKGRIIVRSKTEIEKNQIIITEIPYETLKANIVKKIDDIRMQKKVNGILEVRDESDREGLRIAVELRKDANTEVIFNYLLKNTEMQNSYNFNMVAIDKKRPVLMNLKMILDSYIKHQKDVYTNRSNFELNKAKQRAHIVDGLIKMVSILDEVIKTIRESNNKQNAKDNLIAKFDFTDDQAEAIVTLQLYRLSNTDVLALEKESDDLRKEIDYLQNILSSQQSLINLIKKELLVAKKTLEIDRKTEILESEDQIKIDAIDLVQKENCIISLTNDGYIKRSSVRSYQACQESDMGMKENDYVINISECTTLDTILIFTDLGNYIYYPVYLIPESKWKDIGQHISNLVPLEANENIIYSKVISDFSKDLYLLASTKEAKIKLISLKDLEVSRYNRTIRYIKLKDGDLVSSVSITPFKSKVFVMTKQSAFIKYDSSDIPVINTNSSGVISINLKNRPTDYVVFAALVDDNSDVLVLTTRGNIVRKNITDIENRRKTNKPELLFSLIKTNPHDVLRVIHTNKKEYKDNIKLNLISSETEKIDLFDIKYYTQSEYGRPISKNTHEIIDLVKVEREFNEEDFITDSTNETENIEKSIDDDSIFVEDTAIDNQEEVDQSKKHKFDIFDIIDETEKPDI